MAPEIIENSGYDGAVDYWSLGVMLYEMFAGTTPFCQASLEHTFRDILSHATTLERPTDASMAIPDGAWSLITELIARRAARLRSPDDVQAHPWMEPLGPWEALRDVQPPFVPTIDHETDTSNFDPVYSAGPNEMSQNDIAALAAQGKAISRVIGFTYRRFETVK